MYVEINVATNGNLTLTNVTMSDFNALGSGGAVEASDATLVVSNSTFESNSAYNGGHIWLSGGTL